MPVTSLDKQQGVSFLLPLHSFLIYLFLFYLICIIVTVEAIYNLCNYVRPLQSLGTGISFQRVAPQVLSPLHRFTAKFEMDWSGSNAASAPRSCCVWVVSGRAFQRKPYKVLLPAGRCVVPVQHPPQGCCKDISCHWLEPAAAVRQQAATRRSNSVGLLVCLS